ncbi:40S ribosomal protein S5-1 [Hordeum vulgare]|nr:40S ribosomal protein S5-1 [Hordeum vulgare]
MLHICDVEGPKKTGSVETRLEAMEQQVFKCQGMVEHGLNANHMMITEFTSNHKMDAIDIGKHLSRLYDRVDQLQGQIYDLQNQNCEYEYRFKSDSIKQWQRGFFYVKNANTSHDAINMPPFDIDPPTAKKNWQAKYPKPIAEVAQICVYLESMKTRGLLGRDLLTTMMTRQILPL